jgi:zinc-ribbon domain
MAAGVTMRCAKCGAENRETAKFCEDAAHLLDEAWH